MVRSLLSLSLAILLLTIALLRPGPPRAVVHAAEKRLAAFDCRGVPLAGCAVWVGRGGEWKRVGKTDMMGLLPELPAGELLVLRLEGFVTLVRSLPLGVEPLILRQGGHLGGRVTQGEAGATVLAHAADPDGAAGDGLCTLCPEDPRLDRTRLESDGSFLLRGLDPERRWDLWLLGEGPPLLLARALEVGRIDLELPSER